MALYICIPKPLSPLPGCMRWTTSHRCPRGWPEHLRCSKSAQNHRTASHTCMPSRVLVHELHLRMWKYLMCLAAGADCSWRHAGVLNRIRIICCSYPALGHVIKELASHCEVGAELGRPTSTGRGIPSTTCCGRVFPACYRHLKPCLVCLGPGLNANLK